MKLLILVGFSLFLFGCNKPDPNPELKDPIYQDIQSELSLVEKNIAEAQKNLAENEEHLKKVVPQTGQIKYAEKRVNDVRKIISSFEQQKKYWVIRLDSRRNYVRKKSMEAHLKGEHWSDSKEFEDYQTEKRLRQARQQWDSRQRIEDFMKSEKLEQKNQEKSGE